MFTFGLISTIPPVILTLKIFTLTLMGIPGDGDGLTDGLSEADGDSDGLNDGDNEGE